MQVRIYLIAVVLTYVSSVFAFAGLVPDVSKPFKDGNKKEETGESDKGAGGLLPNGGAEPKSFPLLGGGSRNESGGSNSGLAGLPTNVRDMIPKGVREPVTNEGKDAEPGQFPWSAALFQKGNFLCTSSILSENIVLTAAHCVVSEGKTEPAEEFHAIANVKKSAPEVRIEFASITVHPDYSESGIKNDIAIMRTKEPIPFSENVKNVCIARQDTAPMEYTNATAMGWGDTGRLRVITFLPENLKYFEQKVISNEECSKHYFGGTLEEYKLCAGDLLKGICNGDSGGPLVHLSADKVPVQIGVSSYGNAITGCGFITPSVFARVSYYNDFIKKTADGENICEV